jgi:hypothetical protein
MKRPVKLTSHLLYIDKVGSYATAYQPFNKQTNDNKVFTSRDQSRSTFCFFSCMSFITYHHHHHIIIIHKNVVQDNEISILVIILNGMVV